MTGIHFNKKLQGMNRFQVNLSDTVVGNFRLQHLQNERAFIFQKHASLLISTLIFNQFREVEHVCEVSCLKVLNSNESAGKSSGTLPQPFAVFG